MQGIHFLSLVAGSWGLLKITETTKSILFAAAVHLSFNVLADGAGVINRPLRILGVAGSLWFVLIRFGIIGRAAALKGQCAARPVRGLTPDPVDSIEEE